MYTDPTNIRTNEVRLRLNEREHELIDALVNYTGQQKGPLLREMLLAHATAVLSGQADITLNGFGAEAHVPSRMTA